jgi:hypothetical protein
MTDEAIASAKGGGVIRQNPFGGQYVDRFGSFGGGGSSTSNSTNAAAQQQSSQQRNIFQRTQAALSQRVQLPKSLSWFSSPQSLLRGLFTATALPVVGAMQTTALNVAQTVGKAAAYTPLRGFFAGNWKQGVKELGVVAGTVYATTTGLKGAFHAAQGEGSFKDLIPTKATAQHIAYASFNPLAAGLGFLAGNIKSGSEWLFGKAKEGVSKIPTPNMPTPPNVDGIKEWVDGKLGQGQNALQSFTMPTMPTLPVAVSVGGLGGLGAGLDIAALAAMLGGGYLLGKRKRKRTKRKKYKRSRRKK